MHITRQIRQLVKVAGIIAGGWTLGAGGAVTFTLPPATGTAVTASFSFDVPVRFESDSLMIDSDAFLSGEAASVPLVEVRV